MGEADTLGDLHAAIARAERIVTGIRADQWGLPTPCDGVDVSALVNDLLPRARRLTGKPAALARTPARARRASLAISPGSTAVSLPSRLRMRPSTRTRSTSRGVAAVTRRRAGSVTTPRLGESGETTMTSAR